RLGLRQETVDGHDVTGAQRVAVPTRAHEPVRRPELEVPIDDVALLVLDVDIDSRVRIGPLELGDRAGERDRLVAVVLGGERMVGKSRSRYGASDDCEQNLSNPWPNSVDHPKRSPSYAEPNAAAGMIP